MEAEYPQANPRLCPRRRKRGEEDELLLLAMDLDAAESHQATDELNAVAKDLGHEIRVFSSTTFESIPSTLPMADHEEDDDFYELQPADYFNLISNRMAEQSKVLKTRKMREAELAAQRANITKAVMRVRFPDGYILEADFLPSETVRSLVDLLMKVIARPDLPFYLYTVPPKKRILDTSQDFYTVGFVPGANVFFSYDLPEGSELNTDGVKSGAYLREEIQTLDGLSLASKPAHQSDDSKMNSASVHQSEESQSDSALPANKKPARPKWFKSDLQVHPSLQRRGIGQKILERITRGWDCPTFHLESWWSKIMPIKAKLADPSFALRSRLNLSEYSSSEAHSKGFLRWRAFSVLTAFPDVAQ